MQTNPDEYNHSFSMYETITMTIIITITMTIIITITMTIITFRNKNDGCEYIRAAWIER